MSAEDREMTTNITNEISDRELNEVSGGQSPNGKHPKCKICGKYQVNIWVRPDQVDKYICKECAEKSGNSKVYF